MRELIKRLVKGAGIHYDRYRILEAPADSLRATDIVVPVVSTLVEQASAPEIRAVAWYGGSEARGYGLMRDGELVAVCWYWFGERYKERNLIPLPMPAAKLVQITTAIAYRGCGLAPALIRGSARAMMAEGFSPLYARVWHSHSSSLAAFRKAGWHRRQMITIVQLPGFNPWRFETVLGRE